MLWWASRLRRHIKRKRSEEMLVPRVFSVFCVVLLAVQSGHGSEIIGGTEVVPHSLPYMAVLRDRNKLCGGILIDPKWVLTAAHCKGLKEVWLGTHSLSKEEKGSRQVIQVQRSLPHPCYDKTEKVNDLMLLKLKKPAKQTETVKHFRLNNNMQEPKAGTACLVAGWGKTETSGKKRSDVLMSVNVTVIDRVKCNSPEYYNGDPVITSGMICAGSVSKKKADTCQGDSGGPLICNGALAGVTSFGKQCGDVKKPGVYSFVSKNQLLWIHKTMKKSEI